MIKFHFTFCFLTKSKIPKIMLYHSIKILISHMNINFSINFLIILPDSVY